MSKFILVDGMSMVFRAYHAMIKSGLKNKFEEPTGAIFGTSNILTQILDKEKPERIAVIFDTPAPTFRESLYPDYKANRDAFPEDLAPQLIKIKELLNLLGIPQIELDGYEADDIIGTLAKQSSSQEIEVFCLTADKDFYQLVDDHITIMKPSRKGEDIELVSYEGVKTKFGVLPSQVIDVQALIGDSVDNVPGVKGIGEKTAIPFIQKYTSIENLYNNIDELPDNAAKKKLIEGKELAFLSKTLVTIKTDVPLNFTIDDCFLKQIDFQKLDNFFAEQGFRALRLKWQEKNITLNKEVGENTDIVESIEINKDSGLYSNYTKISSVQDLEDIIPYLSKSKELTIYPIFSSGSREESKLLALSISKQKSEVFLIELNSVESYVEKENINSSLFTDLSDSKSNNKFDEKTENMLLLLKAILEDKSINKIGYDLKNVIYKLKEYNINLSPINFDCLIASLVLDQDGKHNIDFLIDKFLNKDVEKDVLNRKFVNNRNFREKNQNAPTQNYTAENYQQLLKACLYCELITDLKAELESNLSQKNLLELCNIIEFPVIEVLADMEFNGIALSTDKLSLLSVECGNKINEISSEVFKETGEIFNLDSPKQLATILFEKLRLPIIKKTKTGYSTDQEVLSELAISFPIAEQILEYRQLVKLKSTYIDALPKLLSHRDNKLHTTYNQLGAGTGRLSSNEPNLQNIPIRTPLGKEIRKSFVSNSNDTLLLSADYSQVELRIMAFLSQDKFLTQAFKNGDDIHAATAANLFNKTITEVDTDERRIAKTVNFGIMYGLGSFGLAQRLKIGRKEAKDIIDNYFLKYNGISEYISETIKFVEKNGYAITLCGRKRNFNDINSKNRMLKTAAERAAINMPIQGTASDMMKIAMKNVYKNLLTHNFKTKILLQIHDELVLEVPKYELEQVKTMVTETMQNALNLGEVPVIVETGYGENWLQAH